MKIAVIGAGVVGITSAYTLAQNGHQVRVFERNGAIAEEASFAPAGILSPSLLHPLSHSRWPGGSWLGQFKRDHVIRLRANVSLRDLAWLRGWQKNTASEVFEARLRQLQQLLQFSQQCLQQICIDAAITPEQAQGQLALYQTEAALVAAQPKLELLKSIGVSLQMLDRAQALRQEPALDSEFPVHAAVLFPNDEVINSRQFAHLLKERASQLGVQFQFGAELQAIQPGPQVQLQFASDADWQSFDRVLLCTGAANPATHVISRLPLTQMHSYSVSAPIREALNAPRSAIFDVETATSIGRLGARVRVSGSAELGQASAKMQTKNSRHLFSVLQKTFPGAASYKSGTQVWRGSSAFTPDGLPLVGPTGSPGVWLNVGHGQHGFGMSCGAAQLIADMLAGRESGVDPAPFQASRWPS